MRKILLLVACFCCSGLATANTRDVSLTTADHVNIRATLSTPDETGTPAAAVILIHQGGSNRREWEPLVPQLLSQGYVVLAYDVRGHGESDPVDSVYKLFNDPAQAPLDLQAAIHFLTALPGVDAQRIAVVGASIGANLAAMASSEMGIKTAVAISGKTAAVYNLAGKSALALRSVFYIAADGDQNGRRAGWAKELFDRTAEPRRLEIVANSSRHGVGIFDDRPRVMQMILEWLQTTL